MPSPIMPLQEGETLWVWPNNKPPTRLLGGEASRGFCIRSHFARGRLPMDQFIKGDSRFIEPLGFGVEELLRPSSDLGYFARAEGAPPLRIQHIAQEMAVRGAGLPIMSPREGDRVVQWDYVENGVSGRLSLLFADGMTMAEARGLGDARPVLMVAEDECVRRRDLMVTTATREMNLAQAGVGVQGEMLFAPAPLPVPTAGRGGPTQ